MNNYYLNRNQQDNGDYEVHVMNCKKGADPENQLPLGIHPHCMSAVARAKILYPQIADFINGCYWCSLSCHTS